MPGDTFACHSGERRASDISQAEGRDRAKDAAMHGPSTTKDIQPQMSAVLRWGGNPTLDENSMR